jgi:hypothetical protein
VGDVPTSEPPQPRPTVVVLDIDGVIADVRHRLHHVERRPKDWDAFFGAMDGDDLLPEGRDVAREAVAAGHAVVYLTGRNESHREVTRAWLERHGLPEGPLVMRGEDDRRPARLFKPGALRRIAKAADVVEVVDDDDAVVRVLQQEGWPVRHATWMRSGDTGQRSLFEAQEVEGRS